MDGSFFIYTLMLASDLTVYAVIPDVHFAALSAETSHKKKQRERAGGSGTKRPAPLPVPDAMPAAAGADTPLQVAPAAAQPPAALTGTPASGGAPRNKRARTSLKLNLSGSEKATLAPTLLEEAAGVADSLQKIMTAFCEAHKDLAQDGETYSHTLSMNDATANCAAWTRPRPVMTSKPG